MAIAFEDESPVKGRIVFDDEKPKRSLINRLTGGAITTRSDEGFRPAETGFAPLQAYRAIRPLLDNPEVQAAGARIGGAVSGGVMGGLAGAPVAGFGAIPGAILGALAGAAAVEPTAQNITPREESLAETSINLASAGLPPLGRIASVAPRLASVVNPRVLQAVGEGAYGVGVGEAQLLGQKLLEEGRLPTADEAKNTALIGGLIGTAAGGILPTPVGDGAIPQIPKSTQILQDAAKPKSLANVASESAAKTGGNPYAVQESINKMMQIPDPAPMAPVAAQQSAEAMQPLLEAQEDAVKAFKKQVSVDEKLTLSSSGETVTPNSYSLKSPVSLAEASGSIDDILAFRKERIDNYRNAIKEEIGLSNEEADGLLRLLRRDADTERFESRLSPEKRDKFNEFFDGPMNQRNGPLEQWTDSNIDLDEIAKADDREWLAEKVVGSLANVSGGPEFGMSDEFIAPIIALQRLRELGGDWRVVDSALRDKLSRMRSGGDFNELYSAYGSSIKNFASQNGVDLPIGPKGQFGEIGQIAEFNNPSLPQIQEPILSPQAQRMQDEYGRVNPQLLGPVAGAGAGGVAGYFNTERREGETDQEFEARRIANTLIAAAGGGFSAAGAAALGSRLRGSSSPEVSNRVGKNLGIINDFKTIANDVSNAKLRLDRFANVMMRGTKMRKPFVEAKRNAEAAIDAAIDEARILLSDARGKINAYAPRGPQRDALEEKLNEVFADISKVDELPEQFRPIVNRMFKIRQDNATKIAALEGVTDSQRNTILEKGGNYLARNYAIFRNNTPMEARAYRNAIPKEDINAALDAIQETWGSVEKPINRTEAQALLNEFLDRDNFLGFTLGRKQIGGKDVTSLYQKKNIDPRLRKVLGEVKDPLDNAYHSIENQVNLIERDKQQRDFIDIGEKMGIFTRDPDVAAQNGMVPFVQSAKEQNSAYDNWAGVFVNPVFRDEFAGTIQKAGDSNKIIDAGLGTIKAATAAFKWLKIVPSPDSRAVNLIGAWWNNATNGRGINPFNKESITGVKAILMGNGIMLPDGSPNTKALLEIRKELIGEGVLDQSVLGKDFADNFKQSSLNNMFGKLDEFAQKEIDNPRIRKAYATGKFLASGKEFGAPDEVMKVVGYLIEKERYRKAFPDMPEKELRRLAGRVMNKTGMTYSEVPEFIRQPSQIGVIEAFTSFPYSVIRSTVNSARLGYSELMDGIQTGNRELAKIGGRRLAMLAAGAAAASGYGVSAMINREHGVSEEQERAAKTFTMDYVRDSPLAFDAPIKDGKVEFVQMNYLLPTGLVTSAIEAGINAAKEDGLLAGAKAAAGSVASQFTSFGDDGNPFGPALTTIGKALGIINKDEFGRQIWNPQDPDKWDRIAASIMRDWAAGGHSKAERVYYANNPEIAAAERPGREFSNKEELLRFLGRRATTIDIKKLIPSKAYSLYNDYLDASKLYSQEVNRDRLAGDEAASAEAFAQGEGVVKERFNDLVGMVDDARILKVSDEVIQRGLIQGGLPKKLVTQIMSEVYVPPSKERADMLMQSRDVRRENYRDFGEQSSGTKTSQAAIIYDRLMSLPENQRAQLWNQLSRSGQVTPDVAREIELIHQTRNPR